MKNNQTNKQTKKKPLADYSWTQVLMVSILRNTQLEKTDFSFASEHQLQIAFWLGMGAHVHLLLSVLEPSLVYICTGFVYVATVSEFMFLSDLLCLEYTVTIKLPTSSGSYNFVSCTDSWVLERSLMKTSHVRLSALWTAYSCGSLLTSVF